ncbi:MAG: AAA family ATPase [bacterium]|nr:AAA family ATPase [bacterium]
MSIIKKGTVFIIEGLWGTGKTTYARRLAAQKRALVIREPHHLRARRGGLAPRVLTEWYLRQHLRNLHRAVHAAIRGRNAVIERSPLSSVAFARAYLDMRIPLRPIISEFLAARRELGRKIVVVHLQPHTLAAVLRQLNRKRGVREFAVPARIAAFDRNLSAGLARLKRAGAITLLAP